jgi:hypothetical protein
MSVWPGYAQIASISEKPESALVRTQMESGPAKQTRMRSRQTVMRPVLVAIDSLADYTSFKAWIATTLRNGADWFDWSDPVDGIIKRARIVNGDYQGRPLGNSLAYWEVSLTLETVE